MRKIHLLLNLTPVFLGDILTMRMVHGRFLGEAYGGSVVETDIRYYDHILKWWCEGTTLIRTLDPNEVRSLAFKEKKNEKRG